MYTRIYRIIQDDDRFIGMMPRPRGGDWLEDEISHLSKKGVKILVSLLEKDEVLELGLKLEEKLCLLQGIRYIQYPIKDRSIPNNFQESFRFVQTLWEEYQKGHSICVHCRMGIGRSAMIVAAIMILEGNWQVKPSLVRITQTRGMEVPDTEDQINWLHQVYQTKNRQL